MQPRHLGLTITDLVTVTALLVGPAIAIGIQLYFESRRRKRAAKERIFSTLMGFRAFIINPQFVQALNLVDVIFYDNVEVRAKRSEFMAIANGSQGREMKPQEIEACKDLIAEMLAKMGKELGFEFDHTEIKNTAYYPKGFERLDYAAFALREKGLEVLEGKSSIGVVIRDR
jgi:hypothetical protein